MLPITVVEIGDTICGSVAGQLWQRLGAQVVKTPLAALDGEPDWVRAAFGRWDAGKELISDPAVLAEALTCAAIVIDPRWCDGRPAIAAMVDAARPAVRCTIDTGLGFATTGVSITDLEGLVGAAAGVFSSAVSGQGASGVAYIDVPIASVAAGVHIVAATSIALLATTPDGAGGVRTSTVNVELTLTDPSAFHKGVEFSTSTFLEAVRGTQLAASGIYRCVDGRYLQLDAPSQRMAVRLYGALAEAGANAEELAALLMPLEEVTPEAANRTRLALVGLFASAPAPYWEDLLAAHRVPGYVCRSTEEWYVSDTAAAGGAEALAVAPPFVCR